MFNNMLLINHHHRTALAHPHHVQPTPIVHRTPVVDRFDHFEPNRSEAHHPPVRPKEKVFCKC